jgi:hypothetical protein
MSLGHLTQFVTLAGTPPIRPSDIVIVPAWRRPEMFHVTLVKLLEAEAMAKAAGHPGVVYLLAIDRGYHPHTLHVARAFAELEAAERAAIMVWEHGYYGNSFSILNALRYAVMNMADACGAERIHVIEEDVWVRDDYFAWSNAAHAKFTDAFAVSGCRCHNDRPGFEPIVTPDDPEGWLDVHPGTCYRSDYYQSLGVSMKVETIRDHVLPHIVADYFEDPGTYCATRFPGSPWGSTRWEQDGLLNRIADSLNMRIVHPWAQRAAHAGYLGYNRPGDELPGETFAERVEFLQRADAAALNAMTDRKDIVLCDGRGYDPMIGEVIWDAGTPTKQRALWIEPKPNPYTITLEGGVRVAEK